MVLERPIAQGTARNNHVVGVFDDTLEIRSGWQGQNIERIPYKSIIEVQIRGFVNCTLSIKTNDGYIRQFEDMALPDARQIKSAIERQKQRAASYE